MCYLAQAALLLTTGMTTEPVTIMAMKKGMPTRRV